MKVSTKTTKTTIFKFTFWIIFSIVSAGVWANVVDHDADADDVGTTKSWNNASDNLPNRLKYQFNSLMKMKMAENRLAKLGAAYRSPSSASSSLSSSWYGIETESTPEAAAGIPEGFQPQQQEEDGAEDSSTTSDQQEIETEATMDDNDPMADHDGGDGNNIRIAVQSKRRFEFVPVHYDREDQKAPRMIEIVSDTMPLRLHFKSQSAAIVVTQSHMSPPMKPIDETITMDQPFRLKHKAYKPIIQDVNEIIQPYRNIVQQVKPVIEDIRTIVPQDNDIYHRHHHQRPEKREQQLGGTRPAPGANSNPKPNAKPNPNPKLTKASVPIRARSGLNNNNNNYGILQLDQSERVMRTIENVGGPPPPPPPQQQHQHGIRKRMDSFDFFQRRPLFNQNQVKPIRMNMNGRSQKARWDGRWDGHRDRRGGDNNFMRIESSEPEMVYVDRNPQHFMGNPDMIVGDLYKDNIIREDHGLMANLFQPPMVLMQNDHDLLEPHHHLHHLHHGPTAASIFDNGDVTIEEEEEEHNANVLDYMDNGGGGPYLHNNNHDHNHHHHRHHLLHHLDHHHEDEDGHDHDHHHDDHLFATTLV